MARRWRGSRSTGTGTVKIRPLLAWYDLWIGAYWDRQARKLYILPLPCIGIVVSFGPRKSLKQLWREYDEWERSRQ